MAECLTSCGRLDCAERGCIASTGVDFSLPLRPVSSLTLGDIIDLEGDKYADPNHDNMHFDCEYALVSAVIHETSSCTVLCIEGVDHFGFPPEHMVKFIRHDTEFTD